MVFAFIPLFLAQVVCVDNGDGSWTCTGSGIPGVTTNAQGQATCTNCVNMSPAECREKRNSLITDLSNLEIDLQGLVSFASEKAGEVGMMADDFRGFTDYPHSYYGSTYSASNLQSFLASVTGSSGNNASNRQAAVTQLVYEYNDSDNSDYTGDYYMPSSFSANDAWATHQGVYGFWHGSYMVGSQVAPALDRASSALGQCAQQANSMQSDVVSILSTAESINCAPCVLGDGDGGGGSGTQVGCLECYLVFLRRYTEQLDLLNVQVSALTNIQMRILSEVKDINSILPSISNHVGRIDDYLWTDQSNMLANVEAAIIVISNNVDTIQQYYFHTFSNASDISMGVYAGKDTGREMSFAEAYSNVFHYGTEGKDFNENDYIKLDWFRRVELLLTEISGVFNTSIDDEAISDTQYEDMMNKAQQLGDLSGDIDSSGDGVKSVGQSLVGLGRSIGGIFNTGSSSMVLIENWIGGESLVLSPDNTVVQGCRVVFSLIWSVMACVIMWKLLVSAWYVVVDIARWFCTWFPKIYGN